jgi:ubiquinone/menaquinone biosynthesis C-methylase UbiE
MTTTNLEKHTTKNPIGRLALVNFTNTLVKLIKPLTIESILDVGAGEGFTLARLAEENIGKKREGIEYVDEAIELGKKVNPDVNIKKGNIYELPYKDNSFELVICTEVLEHLDHPDQGMGELVRVSSKYLLLTVPNEPFFTIQRFLRGKNILKLGAHPEHLQLWTSSAFERFVKKYAVNLVVKKHPFPWTMVLLEKR